MASSSSSHHHSLLLIFTLLVITATLSTVTARPGLTFHPCNTVVVSTYSFSLLPENPNPNPNHLLHHRLRPQFIVVSTDLRPHHHHFRHRRFLPLMINRLENNNNNNLQQQTIDVVDESERQQAEYLPLGFSSLRDRTKDILSVVASLLFGAACGALTAGTMYLIWSLFNHRHGSYCSLDGFNSDDDDNDNDDDDDLFNPKKKGYVSIPAAPAAVAKAVDSAPATAVAVAVPVKESA